MEQFISNEEGYLNWISDNPNGYVINTTKKVAVEYYVLHNSTCRSISDSENHSRGAFTENKYIKVCSNRLPELEGWLLNRNPKLMHDIKELQCRQCKPLER